MSAIKWSEIFGEPDPGATELHAFYNTLQAKAKELRRGITAPDPDDLDPALRLATATVIAFSPIRAKIVLGSSLLVLDLAFKLDERIQAWMTKAVESFGEEYNMPSEARNIQFLLDIAGITAEKLALMTGVSKSIISRCVNAKTIPHDRTLADIAQFFTNELGHLIGSVTLSDLRHEGFVKRMRSHVSDQRQVFSGNSGNTGKSL